MKKFAVFTIAVVAAQMAFAGAAIAGQEDFFWTESASSSSLNPVCGGSCDKDKDSVKEPKAVQASVTSSSLVPACGSSCPKDKDKQKEPKALMACGSECPKDKDKVKEPKALMACGGSCDKSKDKQKEPKSVALFA